MSVARLGFKMLRRDWRARELLALLAALLIATVCLSAISIFNARVTQAMTDQAATLLGGDRVLVSSQPIPDQWLQRASELGLQTSSTVNFLSVLSQADDFALGAIKAVTENYPLRGRLKISDALYAPGEETDEVPQPGTVWLQGRLLAKLKLSLGQQVTIGSARFTVTQFLQHEPDRAGQWLVVAPRALINRADLDKTKVIQPGSRVRYQLQMIGTEPALNTFANWLKPQLVPGQSLLSVQDDRPGLKRTLEKAYLYLHIAAIVSVILAGVAIAMAMHRYSERHLRTAALYRALGSSQRQILVVFMTNLLAMGVIGIGAGVLLGWSSQTVLERLLANFLPTDLPAASVTSIPYVVVVSLLILLGFGLPPLLRLRKTPAMLALRGQAIAAPWLGRSVYITMLLLLTVLVVWQTQSVPLTLALVAALMAVVLLLWLLGSEFIRYAAWLGRKVGAVSRFAVTNIVQRRKENLTHIVAFGLTIFVICLLVMLQFNLLDYWRQELPEATPNNFVINLNPEQIDPFRQLLTQNNIATQDFYPIVRGRLFSRNGQPIMQTLSLEAQQHNTLRRELNLTWRQTLPAENELLSGVWWAEGQASSALISVEQSMADELGLSLGETLGFRIGDNTVVAKIVNFRRLRWTSFKPNFFVIFSPGALDNMPVNYMTSFYIPKQKRLVLNQLVQQFPNISLFDVADIVNRIKDIVAKANFAISFIVLFIVLIGVVVLFSSIQMTMRARQHDSAVLRALGGTSRLIVSSLLLEFMLLGLIAGLIAVICASLSARFLVITFFSVPFQFQWELWFVVPVTSAIFLGIVGSISALAVLRSSPVRLLREF